MMGPHPRLLSFGHLDSETLQRRYGFYAATPDKLTLVYGAIALSGTVPFARKQNTCSRGCEVQRHVTQTNNQAKIAIQGLMLERLVSKPKPCDCIPSSCRLAAPTRSQR